MRTLLLLTCLLAPSAEAANVILSVYSTAYSTQQFWGFAYDATTGTYYAHNGYGATSTALDIYSSQSAFAANTPTSTVTLPDSSTGCTSQSACYALNGTYYAVVGSDVIGRPTNNTSALEEWLLPSGTASTSTTYSAFGGANGTDTFDWGGFTALNLYEDASGNVYVLAKKSDNSTWEVGTLNTTTLAVTNVFNTGLSSIGYAFLINGELYLGNSYASNVISNAINVHTGAVTGVNYTLQFPGSPSNYYISDAFYNPATDELFINDSTFNNGTGYTNALYDVSSASQDFVVTPEPAAWTGVAAGLALLIARRKLTGSGN